MDLPRCEEEAFVMAVIGRRGSGKGYAVIELLKYFYKGSFDLIIWISPTFQLQEMCLNIPDHTGLIVFTEWRPEIIDALYIYMGQRKLMHLADPTNVPKERCLLILDDVGMLGKKGKLSDQLDRIAFNSRHYNISLIEMVQRSTLISTSVRAQVDCLLYFAEQNPQERINILRSFGMCDKNTFFEIFDRYTEEKYSYVGIRNDGGRLYFFDLDGKITTPRTNRTLPERTRSSGSSDSGIQRVRDSERYSADLRRLQQTSSPTGRRKEENSPTVLERKPFATTTRLPSSISL